MRVPFRVASLAVPGVAALAYGIEEILSSRRWVEPAEAMSQVRAGLLPAALGAALMLAAVAVGRRSRLGYVIGLAMAAGIVGGGFVLIVMAFTAPENQGAYGSISGGLGVAGALVALGGVLYGRSFLQARSSFADRWRRDDLVLALVLGVVLIVSGTVFLALGASLSGS